MTYLKLPMLSVFHEISDEMRKNLYTSREGYYEIIEY